MIKKIMITVLLIIIVLALGLRWYASKVDADLNKSLLAKPYQVQAQYQKLYDELEFVADLHSDALLWNRDLTKEYDYGHVDIPRLRSGNVALQSFTIVTKSPNGQNVHENKGDSDRITLLSIAQWRPISAWFSLYKRAEYQCRKLFKAAEKDKQFRVITSKSELSSYVTDRKENKKLAAGFIGIEGLHCLEGNIENVQKLYDEGVRMMAATHFFDNEMGGSAHGTSGEGLTAFGKEVIKEIERLGIIIDIAHISPQMLEDIYQSTDAVLIDSHTGVRKLCDSARNLSDEQIKMVAERGGVIGVGYFDYALCSTEIDDIVKTMKYIKDLVGVEYIALGSDFDGSVTTPFDTTGLAMILEALMESGFSYEEVKLIFGENVKRVLLENLPM